MRVHRLKRARRALLFFKMSYKLRPPYSTLVDPSFLDTCVRLKIDMIDQLTKLFDGRVTIYVTPCFLNAIRTFPNAKELFDACRPLKVHRCGHDCLSVRGCLLSMAGLHMLSLLHFFLQNARKSFALQFRTSSSAISSDVCRRDVWLQGIGAVMPGVPTIFCNRNCMVMDLPSQQSIEFANLLTAHRLEAGRAQSEVKRSGTGARVKVAPMPARRKRPKAPNPLSNRKKKSSVTPQPKVSPVLPFHYAFSHCRLNVYLKHLLNEIVNSSDNSFAECDIIDTTNPHGMGDCHLSVRRSARMDGCPGPPNRQQLDGKDGEARLLLT